MSKPRVHWRPQTPVSYPSGPGNIRTFVLPNNIVCHAKDWADWAIDLKWVTCKRCLRIGGMHRVDTEETIQRVLRRADPLHSSCDRQDGGGSP